MIHWSRCTEGAFSLKKFLLNCVSLCNTNNDIQHFSPLCRFAKSNESLQHYHGEQGREDENYCLSSSPEVRHGHRSNDKNVLAASQTRRKRISPSQGLASPCQLWCQVGQLNTKLRESSYWDEGRLQKPWSKHFQGVMTLPGPWQCTGGYAHFYGG